MAQNGKAIKARRIGGVKVVPKWNWTREYARDVAKHDRALAKAPTGPAYYSHWHGYTEKRQRYIAKKYRQWLCNARPRLRPDQAEEIIRQQRHAA